MKKLSFLLTAVVALFVASCTTDSTSDVQAVGSEAVVTLTVETVADSRTISDGEKATWLKYAVYNNNWEYLFDEAKEIHGSTDLALNLLTGHTYHLILWADKGTGSPYTVNFEAKTMSVDYANASANDESRDAFYSTLDLDVKGTTNKTVVLRRPFAQINFLTDDVEKAKKAGFVTDNYTTNLEVSAYKTLNLQDGSVSDLETVTFAATAPQTETTQLTTKSGFTGTWISMNYILWGAEKSSVSICKMVANDVNNRSVTVSYPMAPACRNWRTNLVGSLLTDSANIRVEIDPEFEKPVGEYDSDEVFVNQLADGGIVTLQGDIVLTNNPAGLTISKDTEIDLNGHTLTIPDTEGSRASSANAAMFTVEDDANLTIKNGSLVIESTNGKVAGTGVSTGAKNVVLFNSTGELNIDNVTVVGSVIGGARAIEVRAGKAVISNSTFHCAYGSGVNSSDADVTLNNCDITVTGMYSAPYNSVCFSCMYEGKLTVNGGNYKMVNNNTYGTGDTHGGWVGIVMNSGGTLILNDGVFENIPTDGFVPQHERAIIEAENLDPATAKVVFAGGAYKPQHSKVVSGYGDKEYPVLVGADKLADTDGDGYYTIEDNKGYVVDGDNHLVSTGAGLAAAVADAPASATISLTADVDLTGVEYTPRAFSALVFDGNGHTISGAEVVGESGKSALFADTDNFDIKNLTIANSTFVSTNATDKAESAAGALIGFMETHANTTHKLTNCHVVNCTIGSGKYVGGLVGYKDGTSPLELENCSVKNCTIVSNFFDDDIYKGHCGGLVGYFCGAGGSITNCIVEGNTFEALGARCGLFIGSAQADYPVSGSVSNNTGLAQLCGEINKITDWSNVSAVYMATNAAELKAAINAGATLVVVKGEIDLAQVSLDSYNGTIVGADDTAVLTTRNYTPGADEAYSLRSQNITFKKLTVKVPTEEGYYLQSGFVGIGTIVFEECDFEGQVTLNGQATWTFNDCNLVSIAEGAYSSFVYGAKKATFNRCNFSGVDRAAKVYGSGGVLDVEYNTCHFTSSTLGKVAVNIDASFATTTVNLNSCQQTAMAGLYALEGTKGTVYVDGKN